jgi:thiopeptide-type bacteriocin biosynthesis protein
MATHHPPAAPSGQLVDAVRAVLTGENLPDVAARSGLPPADLQSALDVYHAGGKAALHEQAASRWCVVRITFASHDQAEQTMATLVAPALDTLRTGRSPVGWWFTRGHPVWNLYLHRADPLAVRRLFRNLARTRELAATVPETYQPDPSPFGGLTGTDIVHDLFRADSEAILTQVSQNDPFRMRPELSVVLLDALLTAARLDWPARGDLYTHLTTTRPGPDPTASRRLGAEILATLTAPTTNLTAFGSWSDAYATAGSLLADAAAEGHLTSVLTDVLTNIVDAHWHRLGLTTAAQGTLAHAATHAYLPPG